MQGSCTGDRMDRPDAVVWVGGMTNKRPNAGESFLTQLFFCLVDGKSAFFLVEESFFSFSS